MRAPSRGSFRGVLGPTLAIVLTFAAVPILSAAATRFAGSLSALTDVAAFRIAFADAVPSGGAIALLFAFVLVSGTHGPLWRLGLAPGSQ